MSVRNAGIASALGAREQAHARKRTPTLDRGGSLRYLDPVDIDTILTIFAAPADCKDLIRALAADVRELRERNSALVRELEAAQMALTALEQSPPNELLSQAAPTADLDELLRAAAARGQLARVTFAAAYTPVHNGTLEGVPYYCPGATDDTAPWSIHGYWCGTATECDRERIIAVELL